MAFSYPKLTSVTLPSVESWGQNNNILRDPPKSITTRRVDKVGATNFLNEMIDSSTDRADGQIRIYQRGVNPSVSVDYNGNNNAGIVGNMVPSIQGVQAKLPYRVMLDGAFQAPILSQRDLLPISKMNRVYSNNTLDNSSRADYSKTKQCASNYTVVKDLLQAFDVKPNKSFKMEKPILENFKMNEAISDRHINISADSGIRTRDISNYTQTHSDTDKGAIRDVIIEAWADTLPTQNMTQNLSDVEGYGSGQTTIHEPLHYSRGTNLALNKTQLLEGIEGLQQNDRYIQNITQYENNAGYNPSMRIEGEHGDFKTTKNLPTHNYVSQISDTRTFVRHGYDKELIKERKMPNASIEVDRGSYKIQKIEDTLTRGQYKSNHVVLNKGGFQNSGVVPKFGREHADVSSKSSEKSKVNKFILDQQLSRF